MLYYIGSSGTTVQQQFRQQSVAQEHLNEHAQSTSQLGILQRSGNQMQSTEQDTFQRREVGRQTQPMVQQRLGHVQPIRQGIVEQRLSHNQRPINRTLQTPTPSTSSQLSALFNWNCSANVGKKRKSRPSYCKKKLPTWTHTFICLSSTTQESVPHAQERAELQIAGLGEKKITMLADAGVSEIYSELSFHFPNLSTAGGFELMRTPEGGGKILDVIASPESGYNVPYLKAVVHQSKIYIRPLQQNLSLDPVLGEVSGIYCSVKQINILF